MSSSSELQPEAENSWREQTTENAAKWRKELTERKSPRTYVMALRIFSLLTVETLIYWFNIYLLYNVHTPKEFSDHNPTGRNLKLDGLTDFFLLLEAGIIFVNILGGLLIYQYSGYGIILLFVAASFSLYPLSFIGQKEHSPTLFMIVIAGMKIFSVPLYILSLSVWKDWAPSTGRTSLVTISLFGMVLKAISAFLLPYVIWNMLVGSYQNLIFLFVIVGILVVFFRLNFVSDSKGSSTSILQKEFDYFETTISSNYQEKVKLKDVPWKSIAKSKQVIILCLIFFKIAFSVQTIQIAGVHLFLLPHMCYIFFPFLAVFSFILIGTSFLMDFFLQKYKEATLTIRKTFLCTGFGLQSLLLLGAIISHLEYVRAICYVFAYSCLALSIPGALTYPLDLSPRYAPILAGIGFAFFSVGALSTKYFIEHPFPLPFPEESGLFIFDGIMSLCIAIIFGVWGNAEEQPWSLLTSSRRASHDNRSDSQISEEVELDLSSENL